jgi:hypothetical protein
MPWTAETTPKTMRMAAATIPPRRRVRVDREAFCMGLSPFEKVCR